MYEDASALRLTKKAPNLQKSLLGELHFINALHFVLIVLSHKIDPLQLSQVS